MAYGIICNLTNTGSNQYDVHTEVYALSGSTLGVDLKALPNDPFTYTSKQLISTNETKDLSASSLFSFFIPQSEVVQLPQLNYEITNNTYNAAPNKFLGYPNYYSTNLTAFSKCSYLVFGSQKVLYAYYNFGSPTSLATQFYSPFANLNATNVEFTLTLGGGNAVPNQDWAGWIKYGIGIAFPFNFALMIAGVVVLIIKVRRV